jgi:hypothetical protein
MSMNPDCPICGRSGCKTYPLILEKWAAGENREHWKRIHDQMNGLAYPPKLEQAGNALIAAAKFVTSGLHVVSDEERDRRHAICQTPCKHYDNKQDGCYLCGCTTRYKTRLASSSCPIGLW